MAESSRLFEVVQAGFGKLKLAVADVPDDLALCWLCVLYNTSDVRIQRRKVRRVGMKMQIIEG